MLETLKISSTEELSKDFRIIFFLILNEIFIKWSIKTMKLIERFERLEENR